jgi:hypothetical protein
MCIGYPEKKTHRLSGDFNRLVPLDPPRLSEKDEPAPALLSPNRRHLVKILNTSLRMYVMKPTGEWGVLWEKDLGEPIVTLEYNFSGNWVSVTHESRHQFLQVLDGQPV